MAKFGQILSDKAQELIVEVPFIERTPGTGRVVLGSTNTPAVRMTNGNQQVSGAVMAPPDWDTDSNVTALIMVALRNNEANGDTWDIDFDYVFVESGSLVTSDLDKPATSLNKALTVTALQGLSARSVYTLAFELDRNNILNGYAGATEGLFSFAIQRTNAGTIPRMDVVSMAIKFPTGIK